MKKLFSFLLVISIACAASAQTQIKAVALTTTSYGNALDTVVNTATKVTTTYKLGGWRNGVTAQAVVTKISGTVGGSIALQGSMDGTNWSTIGSASTPTDATANYSFNTTTAWYYYRISYAGTGTMSASVKCFLMPY